MPLQTMAARIPVQPPSDRDLYLRGLNDQQEQAVLHDPAVPLQILAGPGSGKTRVIASRIAHLISTELYQPQDVVSVTFTNKAAKEMRVRLEGFLGSERTDRIVLGTFHSVCVRYLRRFHSLVGLSPRFVIQDQSDCAKQIKLLLKPHLSSLPTGISKPERLFQDTISKSKAKGLGPEEVRVKALTGGKDGGEDKVTLAIADVYEAYQLGLEEAEAVDFDDILTKALELFKNHGEMVLFNIRHCFIDEFQDTNTIQYQIACFLAGAKKAITIVGDPDQSIYGWRSAEVENLDIMIKQFGNVKQVFLECNYRSSSGVLDYALAVISQDNKRIAKGLVGMRGSHSVPVQRSLPDRDQEASYIAKEMKRVKHAFGLDWNDFAILMRFNAQSRAFETALQKEGIPNLVLNGRKFFARVEVMLITGYLQLIENENFTPAFERIINVPMRKLGEATIRKIVDGARAAKVSPVQFLRDGTRTGTMPAGVSSAAVKSCREFVEVYDFLRDRANHGTPVAELIQLLLEKVAIEQHLQKEHDFTSRWENVLELQSFTAITEKEIEKMLAKEAEAAEGEEEHPTGIPLAEMTPLRRFLEQASLANDVTDDDDDKENSSKVVMSTIHQAKGLEWPVVFIPSAVEGTLPAFMASGPQEIEEERRLFYVAVTRAEALLYITYTETKTKWDGSQEDVAASRFLPDLTKVKREKGAGSLFSSKVPKADAAGRLALSSFLGRPPPDDDELSLSMQAMALPEQPDDEWFEIVKAPPKDSRRRGIGMGKGKGSYWSAGDDVYALPPMPDSLDAPSSSMSSPAFPPRASSSVDTLGGFVPASQFASSSRLMSSAPPSSSVAGNLSTFKSFASSMRRGPAPSGKGSRPPPPPPRNRKPDPPKWAPKRGTDDQRFSLPPLDPSMARSADPSIPIKRAVPTLHSFENLADESLSLLKNVGLPPAEPIDLTSSSPPRASHPQRSAPSRKPATTSAGSGVPLNPHAAAWIPPSSNLPPAPPLTAGPVTRKRTLASTSSKSTRGRATKRKK